ncbi:hypothetical protein PS850_02452 [Pseudomonas fluorescens]|nr:hypothetical protein PS850_02452 [Pseudomonas fluorescens]
MSSRRQPGWLLIWIRLSVLPEKADLRERRLFKLEAEVENFTPLINKYASLQFFLKRLPIDCRLLVSNEAGRFRRFDHPVIYFVFPCFVFFVLFLHLL